MFRILFHSPEIPGNTGNAIRLAAITGAELHLVEPLGFDFSDAKLRRAGLDYHDLAVVTVHKTSRTPGRRSSRSAFTPSPPTASCPTRTSPTSPAMS